MVAETNTDAPKSFCDAPGGTGHRDIARSESAARELGRSAAAKAGAEVGWNRSSVEAGNDRGAKGSCIGSASNRSAGADSLRKKRMTEEEIATKDRVVQMAVKLVMEPIFEADFHDCSFGFRPNRSAQDAAERIAEKVKEGDAK
ncbi:MAG: hypothetical protein SPG40_08850, partial [Kiritimatiellia bacterium]|nr:hypothetical protein [Kiritimatiellia bacterium]